MAHPVAVTTPRARKTTTPRDSRAAELLPMPTSAWAAYLSAHSGLPGPRANLELVAAFAPLADEPTIDALLTTGDEYHAMCAAAALGMRVEGAASEKRARELAADARWRVREGVALGLQLLGDARPAALASIVDAWVDRAHPLVQRAALAAICEPRLLRDPRMAELALDACERTTQYLASQPPAERKTPDVRTLRLALGYCWSVAVAADPMRGLPVFAALDTGDPDVAWIVTQNCRKKRLSRLLDS
nr:HEAT repeat domain-containing protein [Microbacterium sp. 67-17]